MVILHIDNLKANIDQKEILKGVTLEIHKGKTHVLMGQNGSGKSTLAQTLMGNPTYEVTNGKVEFDNKNLLEMNPSERSLAGVFLSFQYPSEITGVTISNFLRMVYNKRQKQPLSPIKFRKLLKEKSGLLKIDDTFMNRYLNEGFSGGEKKRMEMLQMLVIEPKLAILDETDSGLDIDALKIVAEAVNYLKEQNNMTVVLITHYSRILDHINPDKVYIMEGGKIVKEGGIELVQKLESTGYKTIAKS